MFNGWTKFNKVLLIISIICNIIMLIVAVCVLSDTFYWFEKNTVVFVIAGLFGIMMSHALWGLFIEMSRNIIRIGEKNLVNQSASARISAVNDYTHEGRISVPKSDSAVSGSQEQSGTLASRITALQNAAVPGAQKNTGSETAEALRRICNDNK